MRVAFIGNICGNAYIWSKLLRREGLEVDLFLRHKEVDYIGPAWEDPELAGTELPDWIKVYEKNPPSYSSRWGKWLQFAFATKDRHMFLKELAGYDVVHSFTGALFFSPGAAFKYGVLGAGPYIACATGSDIVEEPYRYGLTGLGLRLYFKRATRTFLLNIHMLQEPAKLGLKNAEFFPFLIDTEKYTPAPVARRYGTPEDILFFMPSNLDWGSTDNRPGRRSTKGNDKFIKAFIRYVRAGGAAHTVLLDRGADARQAHRLIEETGVEDHFTFVQELTKAELIDHYRMADVVVDQFDVGATGTIGLEAMACAKPLMINLDPEYVDASYPEPPPIIYARTEAEILGWLDNLRDRSFLAERGRQAREWILRHHDGRHLARKLISFYQNLSDQGRAG